ncbi:hypothetical protein CYMTET_31409 [Cymbomonas tetramitiformis]|uniref:Right handed beta helix domain-containing protein n=1 Tax=Cymbomonas tetramitiformis TaxID=36881 RepID=A0AAE0KSW8_9CHLO|nr:hypothetical protein CYMTET_31409 [Cymbomonas tetramitiformis]
MIEIHFQEEFCRIISCGVRHPEVIEGCISASDQAAFQRHLEAFRFGQGSNKLDDLASGDATANAKDTAVSIPSQKTINFKEINSEDIDDVIDEEYDRVLGGAQTGASRFSQRTERVLIYSHADAERPDAERRLEEEETEDAGNEVVVIAEDDSAFANLAEAILNASIGTCLLHTNVSISAYALPNITRNFEILGRCDEGTNGLCTIDGGEWFRILHVANAALRLERIALVRGAALEAEGGGLLLAAGTSAVLMNCRLAYNTALNGGGISLGAGSALSLSGTELAENKATHRGGGVFGRGRVTLEAFQSELRSNEAAIKGGGAMLEEALSTVIVLEEVRLSANAAGETGAGLSVECAQSDSTAFCVDAALRDTQVTHNRAGEMGGGIYFQGNTNEHVKGANNMMQIRLERVDLAHNNAGMDGGPGLKGAWNERRGGGLGVVDRNCRSLEMHIENSTVEDNHAELSGGGVYVEIFFRGKKANIHLRGSTLTGNSAGECGAACVQGGNVLITNGSEVSSNVALEEDGAVCLRGEFDFEMRDSAASFNHATTNGGAFSLMAGAEASSSRAVFSSCRLVQNSAFKGGAIATDAADVSLVDCALSDNLASEYAGAIHLEGSGDNNTRLSLGNCSLTGNKVTLGLGGALHSYAVYLVEIHSCTISNNYARLGGGGLYFSHAYHRGRLQIGRTAISDNSADGGLGGGIQGKLANITVDEGSVLSGNFAVNGGGIAHAYGRLVIDGGSSVADNSCRDKGGGIFSFSQTYTEIRGGSKLNNNQATKEGGGLYLEPGTAMEKTAVVVTQFSAVDGNRALRYSGGGVAAMEHTTITFTDSSLSHNSAQVDGGGIHGTLCHLHMRGLISIGNYAGTAGGGLMLEDQSEAAIADSRFTGNMARVNGGTIAASDSRVEVGLPAQGAVWMMEATDISNQTGYGVLVNSSRASHGNAFSFVACDVAMTSVLAKDNGDETDLDVATVDLGHGSSMSMASSALRGNLGTGLRITNLSVAHIFSSDFLGQHAIEGGGVFVDLGGLAYVHSCSFTANVAEWGSGVFSSGNLTLYNSTFHENHATHEGASVHLILSPSQSTVIHRCNFTANEAVNGAVFFFEDVTQGGGRGSAILEELRFEGNHASGGGSVGFWSAVDLHELPRPPPCINCTLVNSTNTAAYASVDGWATPALDLHVESLQGPAASTQGLRNSIIVKVLDANGVVVTTDSTSFVTPVSTADSPCFIYSDDPVEVAKRGVARFSRSITFLGPAGALCLLYFTSSLSGLYEPNVISNITGVPLRFCDRGEEYLPVTTPNRLDAGECSPCQPGSVSFDNSSECISCAEHSDMINCTGASGYLVCQGSWLAPNAQYCEQDAACLLERLYTCDVGEACTTGGGSEDDCSLVTANAGRSGTSAEEVAQLELCNLEMYFGGVQCGGTSPAICSEDHWLDLVAGACVACPGAGPLLARFLFVILLALLLLVGIFYLFAKVGSAVTVQAKDTLGDDLENEGYNMVGDANTALGLVLGYIQALRSAGDLAAQRRMEAEDLQWRASTRNSCLGAALFIILFIHPGISTTMFHLFNCQAVYNDAPSMQRQFYLQQDRSVECFTASYFLAVVFDIFTLLVYVFGYPSGILLTMRYLRSFQKVKLPREAAEAQLQLVADGVWMAVDPADKLLLRVYKSFYPDESKLQGLSARDEALAKDMILKMSSGAGVDGAGSAGSTVAKAALKWRKRSIRSRRQLIEVYIRRDTFEDIGKVDEDEDVEQKVDEARQRMSNKRGRVQKQPLTASPPLESAAAMRDIDDCRRTAIVLNSGHVLKDVELLQKDGGGDHGESNQVPLTRLDDQRYAKVLGQYFEPFEDKFFYWQCLEMIRRLAQTGVVVAVSMCVGETAALTYAMLVAFYFVVIHQRHSPFRSDALDELQLLILCSQFLTQVMVMIFAISNDGELYIGIAFVIVQAILMTYSFSFFVPTFQPLFDQIASMLLMAKRSLDPPKDSPQEVMMEVNQMANDEIVGNEDEGHLFTFPVEQSNNTLWGMNSEEVEKELSGATEAIVTDDHSSASQEPPHMRMAMRDCDENF